MGSLRPSLVSPWRALLPMLFSRERYLVLAVSHAVALRSIYMQNQPVPADSSSPTSIWLKETRENLAAHTHVVVRCFWSSLAMICVLIVFALLIAFLFGRIAPDSPFNIG